MRIDAWRLGEFYTLEAEMVREQSGEDSNFYCSTVTGGVFTGVKKSPYWGLFFPGQEKFIWAMVFHRPY